MIAAAAANAVDAGAWPPLPGHHHLHAGSAASGPCAAAALHAPRSPFTTLVDEAAATTWHLSEDDALHSDIGRLDAVDLPSFFPMSSPCTSPGHSEPTPGQGSSVASAAGGRELPWSSFISRDSTLGWDVVSGGAPSEPGPDSSLATAAAIVPAAAMASGAELFGRRYGSRSSILSGAGGSVVSGSSYGGEARAQRKGASLQPGGEGAINGSAKQQQPEDGSVGGAITAAAAGMRLSRARL